MLRGRGIGERVPGRFETIERERECGPAGAPTDDFESSFDHELSPATVVREELVRSMIMRNDSPDLPFEQSLNPYRGCEHGCVYCYARPAHALIDLSPGLDFETQIFFKPNAVEVLRKELSRASYVCSPIAIGGNTDAYQPLERKTQLTRSILELLSAHHHPATLITKSSLIVRDLDVLSDMAARSLAAVSVSLTTLDRQLASKMEPRAAAPHARLQTIERLAKAGVPVSVMCAPVIPGLNDHELERILGAARSAGAERASYILLRLPNEVEDLFVQWLEQAYPEKLARITHLLRQMRAGNLSDARFGTRMKGSGKLAALLAARFRSAAKRNGLDRGARSLITANFQPPFAAKLPKRRSAEAKQFELFGEPR